MKAIAGGADLLRELESTVVEARARPVAGVQQAGEHGFVESGGGQQRTAREERKKMTA